MLFGSLVLGVFIVAPRVVAADTDVGEQQSYVADVALQTDVQFLQLLERAEQLLLAGLPLPDNDARVVFVLHGPVLKSLLRQNYLDNKRLVDLAAALSALDVIDVKACSTWMSYNGIAETELQPFVQPVAYGPALVERLLKESNYLYF